MKSTEAKWDGKGRGTPLGYRFFIVTARVFGLLPAYFFLVFVTLTFAIKEKKARAALRTFRTRLGLRSTFWQLYRHFLSFGVSIVDRFAFLQMKRNPFRYCCVNEDGIVDTVNKGKGMIMLCSHVGNWEVGGNLLNDRIKTPINLVMLDAEKEKLQQAMRGVMGNRRINVIPLSPLGSDIAIPIINALRRGEIVSFMGDRLMQQKGEYIEFLGKPALFPKGPFAIAALTGAPIVPIVTLKTGFRDYRFRAWDPIWVPVVDRSQREQAVLDAMKKYVTILEEIARSAPYQWFNFFEFWD